jgi:hypothetical protein
LRAVGTQVHPLNAMAELVAARYIGTEEGQFQTEFHDWYMIGWIGVD